MKEKVKQGIHKSIPVYWALIAPTIAFLLLLLTMFIYIDHSNKQNDQRWCALMTNLDKRYQSAVSNPPKDPAQASNLKTTAQQFHELTRSLGCE